MFDPYIIGIYKLASDVLRYPKQFERYKQIRNLVTSGVRKSRQLVTDKLANDLKTTSTGQKNWWKTLKGFIKPSQNSSIPPLQLNDQVFF